MPAENDLMSAGATTHRQPRGIPIGGQFAESSHDEAAPLSRSWDDMSAAEHKSAVSESILRVLSEHGINDWKVRFTRAYSTLGSANFRTKTVNVSVLQFPNGRDVTMDTAMHEAAHVIAGASAGHGPEWKRKARELGASPVARHDISVDSGGPDEQTVRTRYGDVRVVKGETKFSQRGVEYTVTDVRPSKVVGTDARGSSIVFPVDVVHPDFGDVSKIVAGATKTMTTSDGVKVTATEGETTFDHGGVTYTVTEIRRSKFVAMNGDGRRFLFDARKLDPMERKLTLAFAEARRRAAARRQ